MAQALLSGEYPPSGTQFCGKVQLSVGKGRGSSAPFLIYSMKFAGGNTEPDGKNPEKGNILDLQNHTSLTNQCQSIIKPGHGS